MVNVTLGTYRAISSRINKDIFSSIQNYFVRLQISWLYYNVWFTEFFSTSSSSSSNSKKLETFRFCFVCFACFWKLSISNVSNDILMGCKFFKFFCKNVKHSRTKKSFELWTSSNPHKKVHSKRVRNILPRKCNLIAIHAIVPICRVFFCCPLIAISLVVQFLLSFWEHETKTTIRTICLLATNLLFTVVVVAPFFFGALCFYVFLCVFL